MPLHLGADPNTTHSELGQLKLDKLEQCQEHDIEPADIAKGALKNMKRNPPTKDLSGILFQIKNHELKNKIKIIIKRKSNKKQIEVFSTY